MKVCIIQPPYSVDINDSDKCFNKQIELLKKCDSSMDIILLPESADIPALAKTRCEAYESYKKYNKTLLDLARDTAKRCEAILFVNARSFEESENGRNTTYAFNKNGELAGKYFKQHLTPGEVSNMHLDSDYTYTHSEPTVIEIDGIRFAFLTCYDFYFYESFGNIARQNVDVIIGCSHQRSDTHLALEIITQSLAYNTNAYVLRSSVSMDEGADIGGGSMVVAPNGEILLNMKSRVGLETVDIDPHKKYYKPQGFGNPPAAHYEYIEKGRRPWKYRPGGSAIVPDDKVMPYPRVCSSGSLGDMPKNSLAVFGAAVAMGVEEIMLDVHLTKDGVPVVTHTDILEHLCDQDGRLGNYTLCELNGFDFGKKYSEKYSGTRITTLEDVFKRLSCHCVMNINVTSLTGNTSAINDIVGLIKRYDCEKYVYLAMENSLQLKELGEKYPKVPRCMIVRHGEWDSVLEAHSCGCVRIQLPKSDITAETVKSAKEYGVCISTVCNESYKDIQRLFDLGVNVIITSDCIKATQIKKNTI